jgi:hypothetical protein
MEHIGIDVQKVESQLCVLTESGQIIERRIRTQRERWLGSIVADDVRSFLDRGRVDDLSAALAVEGGT